VLTLYIGNKNYSSWSLRPWVLMRTLDIPFEEKLVPFADGGSYAKYRAFSPSGTVPTLIDDQQTVWDSLAIIEYLAETHPAVWPSNRTARAFSRSAAAEMHSSFSALRSQCSMSVGLRVSLTEHSPGLTRDIARLEELWLEGLARFGGPYLAGPTFTGVDAFYAPVAFRAQTYGLQLSPQAQAYVDRLLDLPAMRTWYRDSLAETFRYRHHDAEINAVGTITQDLRAT
jgi:glutathione S-transferase